MSKGDKPAPAPISTPVSAPVSAPTPTNRQKRQAAQIGAGYEKNGMPSDAAKALAWAIVNRLHDEGGKSGTVRRLGRP